MTTTENNVEEIKTDLTNVPNSGEDELPDCPEGFVVIDADNAESETNTEATETEPKPVDADKEKGNKTVDVKKDGDVKKDDSDVKKDDSDVKKDDTDTSDSKPNGQKSSPRQKSPRKQDAPDIEDRLKEMKMINDLTKEELNSANETIKEYKKKVEKLEQRVKQQEQELQKSRSSEKNAKKVEEELDSLKKITVLKAARASEMEKNLTMMKENQEELTQENIQLRDKLENLKEKSSQFEKDKSKLKRRITELEEKIDSLTKKNRQMNEATIEYRSYVEDLKTRNSLQEKKIERLTKQQDGRKRSGTDLERDDMSLSKKKKSEGDSPVLVADKREKREHSHGRDSREPRERREHSHGRDSREPRERCEHSHGRDSREPREKREHSHGRDSREPKPEHTSSRHSHELQKSAPTVFTEDDIANIGVIGDANAKYIVPILQSTSNKVWTAIPGMQTVDDLEQAVESKSIFEKILQQDQVIIMLGTNNIRRGEDGYTIANRLNEIGKKITLGTATQVKISEIPPTNIGHTDKVIAEVVKINERIRSESKHALHLKRLEPLTLKEILREDGNGFHLTEKAAGQIAKDFDAQALANDAAKILKKTILEMEYNKVGMVVGRKGTQRIALQQQYQVRIICDNERVVIKGNPENRKSCLEEIKKIVSKYRVDSAMGETASNDYNSADYQAYYYDQTYDQNYNQNYNQNSGYGNQYY